MAWLACSINAPPMLVAKGRAFPNLSQPISSTSNNSIHPFATVKSCASLSGALAIIQITIPLSTSLTITPSRSNYPSPGQPITSLRTPTAHAGPSCGCITRAQVQSIAGCLKLSERHVRRILEAFERDGFASLEERRTRPVDHPANQLTLPLMKEILDIQNEHPRAGKFRVRGLLGKQKESDEIPSLATVGRAMARNRQFHGAPPPWSTDKRPEEDDEQLKHSPYRPEYRHQYW